MTKGQSTDAAKAIAFVFFQFKKLRVFENARIIAFGFLKLPDFKNARIIALVFKKRLPVTKGQSTDAAKAIAFVYLV